MAIYAALRPRFGQLHAPEQPAGWPQAKPCIAPIAPESQSAELSKKNLPPSPRGVLPTDILDMIFKILQQEELEYWEYHHCFSQDKRYLAECALVSAPWREVALRHLFRDLVFTNGTVTQGTCDLANHDAVHCTDSCGCSCHLPPMKRQGKSLASFAEFVRRSPHVQRHARSLRLRTSPLDVRDELDQPVDAATVLGLLGILPRVTVLHLEDITLARTTPSTPLPPAPPLEHLTLSSCQGLKRASASCILQTLQHFHHISRLRLTHLYEECPWLARSAPVLAQLQLSVHTFELERTKFIGDTVLSFLAASAAGPATVRATLPTDVTTAPRLRRFVKALGPRLAHLEYSLRIRDVPCPTTLLLAGIDPTPADHVVGAALDLGAASGLRTLRLALSLARAKLIPDLVRTATPTLASCRALRGAPFALVLVAPLGEVLEELAFLEEDAREAFKRLEDVLVDLVGRERVERVVFELEVWPAVDDGEVGDKVGRAEELVRAIFPRLDASDGLRVVQNARTEAPRVNVFWGGRYDVPW